MNNTDFSKLNLGLPKFPPKLTRQHNVNAPAETHIKSQLKQGFSKEETIQYVRFCKPKMCIKNIRNLVQKISNNMNPKSKI